MALTIAVLSQKGGTGKTTAVRHLTEAFRDAGLRVLAVDLDPQGNLSDYFDIDPEADPTIGDVLSGRATAADAIHDDVIPANLSLAEAELTLGGKLGRELTLRKALAGRRRRLRRHLHRLPAGPRAPDGQRAGRGRPRAAQQRGAVLRAPGRRAGARGHRARPRQPQPRPPVARRAAEHRRHAHGPLPRGVRVPPGARRRQAPRAHRPPVHRVRRVRRARDLDLRPPPRPRHRLPPRRRGAPAPPRPRHARSNVAAAARRAARRLGPSQQRDRTRDAT